MMNKYERKGLNIKRLLTLGVPNIRAFAEQNETLTADEYFTRLEQFIENAPGYIEIITNLSKLEENTKALKELEAKLGVDERSMDISKDTEMLADLENIRGVLLEIGYDELDFDLDAMCLAINNSNLQLAEKFAVDAAQKLSTFYDSIKDAYSKKKFAAAPPPESESEEEVEAGPLLSEALEMLDYEEETRKLRILAVDDIPLVLNTLTSILSPHYEVFALKNSSQIAGMLAHTTPELFLLDIEMKEINGFDLVPLIRQHEEHKDTPIIFLTGNASLENLKDAIALGASDFITKPVNKEILLEKIAKNIVRKKTY